MGCAHPSKFPGSINQALGPRSGYARAQHEDVNSCSRDDDSKIAPGSTTGLTNSSSASSTPQSSGTFINDDEVKLQETQGSKDTCHTGGARGQEEIDQWWWLSAKDRAHPCVAALLQLEGREPVSEFYELGTDWTARLRKHIETSVHELFES